MKFLPPKYSSVVTHLRVFTVLMEYQYVCGKKSSLKHFVFPEKAACNLKDSPVTEWLSCIVGNAGTMF